jgi:hypothetical protein
MTLVPTQNPGEQLDVIFDTDGFNLGKEPLPRLHHHETPARNIEIIQPRPGGQVHDILVANTRDGFTNEDLKTIANYYNSLRDV